MENMMSQTISMKAPMQSDVFSANQFQASPSCACAACGSQGPFLPALDILLRCSQCDFIFADPQLSYEELIHLYGTSYFTGDEYIDYVGDKDAVQRSFRKKVAHMTKTAPHIKRVFEIGAAYGFFLELAKEQWEVA